MQISYKQLACYVAMLSKVIIIMINVWSSWQLKIQPLVNNSDMCFACHLDSGLRWPSDLKVLSFVVFLAKEAPVLCHNLL